MRVRVDGEKIKQLRLERLMDRNELAEKSDVSYPTIEQMENNGKRTLRRATLDKIAAGLGVDVRELVEEVVLGR